MKAEGTFSAAVLAQKHSFTVRALYGDEGGREAGGEGAVVRRCGEVL